MTRFRVTRNLLALGAPVKIFRLVRNEIEGVRGIAIEREIIQPAISFSSVAAPRVTYIYAFHRAMTSQKQPIFPERCRPKRFPFLVTIDARCKVRCPFENESVLSYSWEWCQILSLKKRGNGVAVIWIDVLKEGKVEQNSSKMNALSFVL